MAFNPAGNPKGEVTKLTATIPTGQTKSGIVDLGTSTLVALQTPAALTGTTLTFEASIDNSTFLPTYDDAGTLISLTVAVSRHFALDPLKFLGVRYLKIVSGSTETGGDDITLLVRIFQ